MSILRGVEKEREKVRELKGRVERNDAKRKAKKIERARQRRSERAREGMGRALALTKRLSGAAVIQGRERFVKRRKLVVGGIWVRWSGGRNLHELKILSLSPNFARKHHGTFEGITQHPEAGWRGGRRAAGLDEYCT
jgi:hypothetical protein